MELSWIQKHILEQLTRVASARLTALLPEGVPANQFSYHLNALIADRLVTKTARGVYALTVEGEKLAGSFSTKTRRHVKDVKTVIMFYAKKDDNYLLFRWSRQPYLHQVTLPHDRVGFEKTLEEAVAEACADKLGVKGARYKTTVSVKIVHGDELVSSITALVFAVESPLLRLPFVSRNGEAFWGTVSDDGVMEGVESLIEYIERGVGLNEVTLRY